MFDIHNSPVDEYGEWDDGAVEDYCQELMEQFADSPEGCATVEHYGCVGWAHSFLYYGFSYLGLAPPEMSRDDVEEILFDIFPRKVSTEAESADEIIGELRAFWEFLTRQYKLPNSTDIIDSLGNEAKQNLRHELANPDNFGMAKSFFMMGAEAGFDMTTQEGLDQFMLAYNASLLQNTDELADLGATEALPESSSQMLPGSRLSVAERKSRRKQLRKRLSNPKRNRRKK